MSKSPKHIVTPNRATKEFRSTIHKGMVRCVALSCVLFSVSGLQPLRCDASEASLDSTSNAAIAGPKPQPSSDTGSAPTPAALIKHPDTVPDRISNLLYIVKHDLVFHRDFYSNKSLRRLLGGSGIQGERTSSEIALTVQLFNEANPRGSSRAVLWIATALIRRDSKGDASIQVQINDPSIRAPYETIERILGSTWQPWHPSTPTPHPPRYALPTAPHGNANMVLHIGSPLADYGIKADFDPDGKLHHFFVSIHPIAGRSPS